MDRSYLVNLPNLIRITRLFSGLVRIWDSKQRLVMMYYMDRLLLTKSMGWKYEYNTLFYQDMSLVKENTWTVIVPMDVSKSIHVGKLSGVTYHIDNLYSANVTTTSFEKDCILQLNWDFLVDKTGYLLNLRNGKIFQRYK